jgi:hypothetical protein
MRGRWDHDFLLKPSPGQGTFRISPDKAPDGAMAVTVIKNRKTGEGLHYTIAQEWLPKIWLD